jgi:threonine dehydrogenase-like Zn-dependent dehydrogenase
VTFVAPHDAPVATRGTMRAAVLVDVGRLEVRDIPLPELTTRDVLIRVSAVGLCGTDLHIVSGEANYSSDDHGRPVPLTDRPQVLGHEIAGVVEEVGSAARDLRVGDRVVVDQGRNCRSEHRDPVCEYCDTGDSHQCEHYREHGITGLPGGFAEYLAIPAVNAVRIDSDLDHAAAALTEPLGCVLHSSALLERVPARYALARNNPRPVRSVVIIGAGPAGLLFLQLLRNVLLFDGDIIVSDPSPVKRALADRFGGFTIDPAAADLVDVVRDRTRGRRAELVIEASGSGPAFATLPGLLRKQGTILLYGHGRAGVDLSVLNQVQFLEPTLLSPAGASGGFEADGRPSTYLRSLRLIESGAVDVASLISHRYTSIESIPSAFDGSHRAPDYVKAVIVQ